jgi:hypothetical protein
MIKVFYRTMMLFMLVALLAGLSACSTERTLAKWHPVEVQAPAICSNCHNDFRKAMDHTAGFGESHRYLAAQRQQVCNLCHAESFCSDCHTHKEEIKPSDKYADSPERELPHRGDYLSQHMIDGRINPASCFKCHGRNNNRRCLTCHR